MPGKMIRIAHRIVGGAPWSVSLKRNGSECRTGGAGRIKGSGRDSIGDCPTPVQCGRCINCSQNRSAGPCGARFCHCKRRTRTVPDLNGHAGGRLARAVSHIRPGVKSPFLIPLHVMSALGRTRVWRPACSQRRRLWVTNREGPAGITLSMTVVPTVRLCHGWSRQKRRLSPNVPP